MKRGGLVLVVLVALAGVDCRGGRKASPTPKRLIVLGIDGLDPEDLQRLMRAGRMPTFSDLAATGTFLPLATSMPPQSPVAWSNFITGMNPGGHGIYDFLRHDRRTFQIAPSTSALEPPTRFLGLPIGGRMVNLRRGRAFWEYLEDRGIPATVFRVPANFPPVGRTARTFSGMGTPDVQGSLGTFTYYTDDPPPNAAQVTGGTVVRVSVTNDIVSTTLTGPPNPFREDGRNVTMPLTVYVDPARRVARLDVGARRVILQPGEWSDWVQVPFTFWRPVAGASGIVRFYLKSLAPHFRLYAGPVNVDPADPAFPISTPPGAVREQAAALGPFHTKGMPAATKALQWGVLSDDEFVVHAQQLVRERERLLAYELARFRGHGGFLFFYFSTIDLASHMLWRAYDRQHPGHRGRFSDRVRNARDRLYEEMDRVLRRVRREVDDRTTLIVMSDHGFAPFYRQVHLNNWLLDHGYLALYEPGSRKGARLDEDVDWSRTKAYALGFNGIFVNLVGREPMGQVLAREKEALVRQLARQLLAWHDPANLKPVVAAVYRPEKIYSGPFVGEAPDLIVGYARGYRASNDTALGELGAAVIEDNLEAWSGDHMMAAEQVPGILLVNRKIRRTAPRLVDLPVTILDFFGIEKPDPMVGSSLFR